MISTGVRTTSLGIPPEEYAYLQNFGRLNEYVENAITQFIEAKRLERIILFGSQKTGKVLQRILGRRFCGFVDSDSLHDLASIDFDVIFLATSPVHYHVITEKIKETFAEKHLQIVTLFDRSQDIDIKLILETQPRSGTHYTINNLMKCLNWGYGSVFDEDLGPGFRRSIDGRFGFIPREDSTEYVIKAHFTTPLHYPEYRYVKTMFQFSYVIDSYYSWGKMLSHRACGLDYKLMSDSKEWEILRSYIPLNKQWLEYISDKFYIRYEDYYLDFGTTIQCIANFIGVPPLKEFEKPRVNKKRMYWSDRYDLFFEEDVFSILANEFYPFIAQFWPEKLENLRY
ncbi:MAG: hypothetical protein DRH17_00845 [Deltaproteobacteria bacterium]|nr:MAG: hypothetical protein DRH17_00845 [Deltaproteobacteria bacterium]